MITIPYADFLRDAASVIKRSETEGPIGILDEDGELHSIVNASTRAERPSDKDVEALAKRMWHRYIASQPKGERRGYARWRDVEDDDTLRGFRALARVTLADGWRTP